MTSEGLPDWLKPLIDVLGSIEAATLSPNFPVVPEGARRAAVLMLFADGAQGPEILLTQRSNRLRNHAGQISFPGGGSDPEDVDAAATALRESHEEVGLDPATVQVFGTLPTLWIAPSNYAVTPVLGYWLEPRQLAVVSEYEVASVIHQPIAQLMDPSNRFSMTHPSGWRGPGFEVGKEVPLWGFTAGIIARLFDEVGWSKPWDETVTRLHPELR